MTPSANRRIPDHLADEIGIAGDKGAPTISDDVRSGDHLRDFRLADAQAFGVVHIRQSTNLT
jgi:hypothetical protein